jgi:hypothetical protein
MSFTPNLVVIVHHHNRLAHLEQSLRSWVDQTKQAPVHVIDIDNGAPDYPPYVSELFVDYTPADDCVISLHSYFGTWNSCLARNIGARKLSANADGIIFAPADAVVNPDFISGIHDSWRDGDAWVNDGLAHGTPHDPSMDGLIVVKKWLNTAMRGFSEDLALNPHGWGGLNNDYYERLRMATEHFGTSPRIYSGNMVRMLHHDDDLRVASYEEQDMGVSESKHLKRSEWYRKNVGWKANQGSDWGVS